MPRKSTRIHHAEGDFAIRSWIMAVACLCLLCFAQLTHAAIEWSGDVVPEEPATWTIHTFGYIGKTGSGTLNITGGDAVIDISGAIGDSSGAIGEVTVDGAGSTWTNTSGVDVGFHGDGTLNITNGGFVDCSYSFIGALSDSTGAVTVDGAGSTWTHTFNLDVGYYGSGTLDIKGGGEVSNNFGDIGYASGSSGEVTVDGSGSTWTNERAIYLTPPTTTYCGLRVGGVAGHGLVGCWADLDRLLKQSIEQFAA